MANDTSFKLYTDAGLTMAFTGTLQLTHNTDLSDGDQDFQFWFGSAEAEDVFSLQAVSNPGIDQITLTPTSITDVWEAGTVYALGAQVRPTVDNTYFYQATVAGTSDSSEPSWPTTPLGSTVVDNTVTWTLIAKEHPITEIKLADTAGGLDSAVAGAAMNLGTTILSGSDNAVEVNVRITNTVTTVCNDTAYPQLDIYINNVREEAV